MFARRSFTLSGLTPSWSRDSDTTGPIFGRHRFLNVATDWMGLAHIDNATAANYAIGQAASGATIVNSKEGTRLTFAQGGSSKWGIEASNYFFSDLGNGGVIHLTERADPSAPADGSLYLYAKSAGAGKTGLYALYNSGTARQINVEL